MTPEDEEKMRHVVGGVLADLQLASRFSSRQMCEAITAHWRTPIEVRPFTRETCPFDEFSTGACQFEGEVFVVHCYSGGSPIQQERIIFHELGHYVFGHVSKDRPGLRRRDPVALTPEELVAECFACQVSLVALFGEPAAQPLQPTEDDPILRWQHSLDG